MMAPNLPLRNGTAGGALLSTLWSIGLHDVLQTAILAAIGAAVSFTVTVALQRIRKKRQ